MTFSRPSSRGIAGCAVLFLVACDKSPPPPPPQSQAPVMATTPPTAAVAPTASAPAKAHADASPPSALARREALRLLNRGRAAAKKGDYASAISDYRTSLARVPNDARVLAELSFAAIQTKDYDTAEIAARDALRATRLPALRAQILYNRGRAEAGRGNVARARTSYAESLTLREDATVRKALAALPASEAGADSTPPMCSASFASVQEMCACFDKAGEAFMMRSPIGGTSTCTVAKDELGAPNLALVTYGSEMELAYLVVAKEEARVRYVAFTGQAYEPGAWGVHNSIELVSATKKTISGHDLAVVRVRDENNDYNMGGLELCVDHRLLDFVCTLPASGTVRCTNGILVERRSGCGPGLEPDEADIDDETRAALVRARARWGSERAPAKFTYQITAQGTVQVRQSSGPKDEDGSDTHGASSAPLW